jgi:hypothetical protein
VAGQSACHAKLSFQRLAKLYWDGFFMPLDFVRLTAHLPQIRTCRFTAYGSSTIGFAWQSHGKSGPEEAGSARSAEYQRVLHYGDVTVEAATFSIGSSHASENTAKNENYRILQSNENDPEA